MSGVAEVSPSPQAASVADETRKWVWFSSPCVSMEIQYIHVHMASLLGVCADPEEGGVGQLREGYEMGLRG